MVTGDPREIADELITHPLVDLVTFTGGVAIGKYIAAKAVYRRQVLELGGNDPLIVLEDADLEGAATLAVQGSYKNSGQRCTAVKRMLVQKSLAADFIESAGREDARWSLRRSLRRGEAYGHGDRRAAARLFEARVNEAVAQRRAAAGRQRAQRRAVLADRARPV